MTASALLEAPANAEVPFEDDLAPDDNATFNEPEATDPLAPVPLVGIELLDFLRENASLPERERVYGAGYYKLIDGKPRLAHSRFHKAISLASGYEPAEPVRKGREQTGPKGILKVGPNGLIPVGAAYSRLLNLVPGQFVSVFEDQGVLVIDPTTQEAQDAFLTEQHKELTAPTNPPQAEPVTDEEATAGGEAVLVTPKATKPKSKAKPKTSEVAA